MVMQTRLMRCGDTHHATGDVAPAWDAWEHALAILEDLQHPGAHEVQAKLTASRRGASTSAG